MPRTKTYRINLYPKNGSKKLDPEIFHNPPAIYRGTPFWSWNNQLDIPQLLRQIDQFKEMGFGGFHIHSRTGLETEYLGDDYMAAVVACTDKAAADGMLSWLYDEDRWPSGFAGGLVTRDKKYRVKQIRWTLNPEHADAILIGRYEVILSDGRLKSYRRLKDSDKPSKKARVWYGYLESPREDSWYNNQTYVDTFSRAAIERFIETTHERFKASVGKYFGGVVPAIFTDEPQFIKKTMFNRADETRDLVMPFTTDFPDTYRARYKQDLLDHLPELFWDLPDGKPSFARYRYHDHTAERFAVAFGDTLARWCGRNGIALTGHMLAEVNLHGQTRGVGEAMRGLRSFHLPGIDILCDRIEFTTAKQAASIAHQYGRPGVLSELYGVTNWDFDFVGHKAQGDWQAALGVTVRVPHLAWASMAGESKRDYPAAIGYQSPWYREYGLIEDHFSRLNTVLTRGEPAVRIGVIHPIESFWLCWGPIETNQPEMQAREEAFKDLTGWLVHSLIDFDYVSEALLESQPPRKQKGKQLRVGEMKYDAVIVPGLRTIRSTTLQRLKHFANAGGTVIFAGEIPSLVDAGPSPAARKLAKHSKKVAFERGPIIGAIEPFREIEVRHEDGSPADSIVHQIRTDRKRQHVFLVNMDRERPRNNVSICLKGKWSAEMLDTMTGEPRPMPAQIESGQTVFTYSFPAHGHLLFTLKPGAAKTEAQPEPPRNWIEIGRLNDPVPVTLSEPNVLLLDQAAWRIGDGEWQPIEEILRIDNLVRQKLNLPLRQGRIAQPWTDTQPAPTVATLQLKFIICSDVHVESPQLALEDAVRAQIQFSTPSPGTPGEGEGGGQCAWWVDESIQTVPLPSFGPGEHELLLTIPFSRKTNLEWCYLLGDFGVAVSGRWAKITAPIRTLAFGDWTNQGLPFYAGNVTYHCTIEGDGREILIEATKFKNPLLTVSLDGQRLGPIAFAPFQIQLGRLAGRHQLDITAYGNRVNAFGAVHNANEALTWYGPAAWRHTGAAWSYEYQLRRMGVLVAPTIKVCIDE